ncbi:MAG: RagB/SusD family nutrient uptake outer membrane protein, partial [Prevotella sp.]|nr:RagB/SusD family nutrient uptake outer membrane protein [Prevotellaceae bacterium]MCH5310255.1 RagB/SusD family nutrient uptake outer membrane protein [Prevotella sp.]
MKKIYSIICAVSTICGMTACSDFLDEDNQTQLSEEQVLTDIKLADLSMQSIYDAFKENYKDERCWFLLQGTDEIQTGALQSKDANTAAWDFCDGAMNSENGYVQNAWNYRWPVIANAAKIVRAISTMNPQAGSAEEQLMGEAAFIRGFLTYQATMIWGRVPIIDLQRIDNGELNYG